MATRMLNFTKRTIEALAPPGTGDRDVYYDEYQHNLLIRVSSGGRKVFYVRRKVNSVSERIQIGRFPDMTVEQARKKASTILGEIESGNNPNDALRKSKAEPTIGELFENYMDGYARQQCIRLKDMESDFRRYISDWSNKKFSLIRRSDVQTRVNRVRDANGPAAANHLIILMRAAINWNLKNEAITGDNPWASVRQYKIQSRERFLKPEELARFFEKLKDVPDQAIQDYVLMSLYTGARKSNVLAMRWDQIDFDLALWRIPITKNKESHVVPLTSSAIEILQRRFDDELDEDWVFPGKLPGTHLVEPKRPWYKLLREAKIEDLRIHDLRRTLGSYMAMGNQSLPIIA